MALPFEPHNWQVAVFKDAYAFLTQSPRGSRRFYVGPTGIGKSYPQAMLLAALPRSILVSPSEDIIDGLVRKGVDPNRVWTPIKLRNRLSSGDVEAPEQLIFDEGHHHNANSWQHLDLLSGLPPAIAFSATYFRGSPKSTRQLREEWGEPVIIMTYPEAAKRGYIQIPQLSIVPLVDDDVIEIGGDGEFEITRLEAETRTRMTDLAHLVRQFYDGNTFDKATFVSLPTRSICAEFNALCAQLGVPMFTINAGTPREERKQIFEGCVGRVLAFNHINIVSEGIDYPFARLIDAQPIISSVKWLQQVGRDMRITADHPEYICTNRNLLRHAYLLEGCFPPSKIIEAQAAFNGPSARSDTRVLGLESIGRFKPTYVKLLNGLRCTMYNISTIRENRIVKMACIVHPLIHDPIWAECAHTRNDDGTKDWGTWGPAEPPMDLQGFHSVGPKRITTKMNDWYKREAKRWGLDPDAVITNKNFAALPILKGLGLRMT